MTIVWPHPNIHACMSCCVSGYTSTLGCVSPQGCGCTWVGHTCIVCCEWRGGTDVEIAAPLSGVLFMYMKQRCMCSGTYAVSDAYTGMHVCRG